MITLKILANGLVVAAAKAATKEVKALSNAVTKNKAQRRTLQVQIDAAFQNGMTDDLYSERSKVLKQSQYGFFSEPLLVEKEIASMCATYSDESFPSELPYATELADLIAVYKEQFDLTKVKDAELVLSTVEDAVGGPDKVWVGTVSPYNNVRSVVEILPITELTKQGNEFAASQLYLSATDMDTYRKSFKDDEPRPHVHCPFFKIVKTGEWVISTDAKLKGSKELVQGYTIEHAAPGGFRRW